METKPKQKSCGEFSEKLTNILSHYISELSPDQQEAKVSAFENAVAKVCRRGTPPRVRRTPGIRPPHVAPSRQ
jgi:hypothetical protein